MTMEVKSHRMFKKTHQENSRFMKNKQKPSDSLGILPNRHTGTACKRAACKRDDAYNHYLHSVF